MKKIIVLITLFLFCPAISSTYSMAIEMPQVCNPETPCVYTGPAVNDSNYTDKIYIKVYAKDGSWVAEIREGETTHTAYVVVNTDGKCYVNYNGKKYYFTV